MPLSAPQLAAIKADIDNTPELAAKPNNSDGNFDIAIYYNVVASPTYFVWRTSVTTEEIMQNGFDWTRVDNLTAGKSRIWEYMTAAGTINPSLANVRAGFLAVFGVAADLNTRQAIFNHSQRAATRIEKLLATGSGTTASEQGVGPATMGFAGQVNFNDIESARNSQG